MAHTDFEQYRAALEEPVDQIATTIPTATVIAGRFTDMWTLTRPVAGVAPTAAVVPTNATPGTFQHTNAGAGQKQLLGAQLNLVFPGVHLIVDRLSHQGGLSGTDITAQTTNLPTAALTRYTSGVGVMIGVSIYTLIGTTATTVSVSYTNSDGVAGRTSIPHIIGGTNFREVARLLLLPLQEGDVGVRSVESVTLTASTGTIGNFGITLFKPLAAVICDDIVGSSISHFVTGKFGGGLPAVEANAALSIIAMHSTTSPIGQSVTYLTEA
jgi:hypothetical protein